MKPWINEETIKTWTDAQKRLWESLCSAVPFQPPVGVEAWRETYLKTWRLGNLRSGRLWNRKPPGSSNGCSGSPTKKERRK